ncbi:MAG TPA: S9 family peptidase [Xanthomonadales bacterium]|nr:S9 family peptidase [Xanthomonadales bacterium]
MKYLILAGALLAPGCAFAAGNAAVPPPAPVEVAKPEVDLADAAPAKPAKGAIPMNDFIRHRQFLDVKVSPTGEYLAASVLATQDTGALVILRRSDLQVTGTMKLRGKNIVGDFYWANDERVVLTTLEKSNGSLDRASPTFEIYATNWDGTKQENLAGLRAERSSTTAARLNAEAEGALLVDTLEKDDKNVLIAAIPLGESDEGAYTRLERLNIYTKSSSVIARAPVRNADFTTDAEGRARFAEGNDVQAMSKLYYRDASGGDWKLINDQNTSGVIVSAVGFTADGQRAYLRSEEQQGPDSLYEWDPKTNERKRVARNANVDPMNVLFTHDGSHPYAVTFMDGGPAITLLDKTAPETQLLRSLLGSFPGYWVSIRSWTKDGSEAVFAVLSDREPGKFYLIDKDKKAKYLMSAAEWIDADRMAEMTPVQIPARDGVVLHGYLTMPVGVEKNAPLIVNPHGGPYGLRDAWSFDEEAQLLASRGYAVLKVNYRGSGGYGRAFEGSGYRQIGRKLQDDLTDATKWAIAQGYADPKRICLYGASYGGYASAMGLVREPDLYRCGVGYVGVYDLNMLYSRPGQYDNDTNENVRKRMFGADRSELSAQSPSNHADAIKAPLFLIAGGRDEIAPIEHSEKMRKAMTDAGKSVEWFEIAHEAHGFVDEESRTELYTRLLAFFDKHIGPGAKPTGAASGAN